jgi:hypothetical protein
MSFTKPTKTSLTNAIITDCETSECNRVNITWEVNGKKYSESNVKINEKDKKVEDKIQIYYANLPYDDFILYLIKIYSNKLKKKKQLMLKNITKIINL